MNIVRTKKAHHCHGCQKMIARGVTALIERIDCGSYTGRRYRHKSCGEKYLWTLLKELGLRYF